jgi:hypothetical protein
VSWHLEDKFTLLKDGELWDAKVSKVEDSADHTPLWSQEDWMKGGPPTSYRIATERVTLTVEVSCVPRGMGVVRNGEGKVRL